MIWGSEKRARAAKFPHTRRARDTRPIPISAKSQGDKTSREQDEGAASGGAKAEPNTATQGTGPRQYQFLSPNLPHKPEDIDRRKAQL